MPIEKFAIKVVISLSNLECKYRNIQKYKWLTYIFEHGVKVTNMEFLMQLQ